MRRLKFVAHHWRLVLLVAIICGVAIAYRVTGARAYFEPTGLSRLQTDMLSLGWRGQFIYLAGYVLLVTLGLPNLPFQLAAGAIYGTGIAYVMMVLGVNLGAAGAFALARGLGRASIEELFGHRLFDLNRRIEHGGFRFLLILRLIPLVPFNATNYAAGISRLRWQTYLIADAIGMLPLTLVHVMVGEAAGELSLTDPSSWANPKLLGPVGFATLLFFAAIIFHRKYTREGPRRRPNHQ